MSTVLSAHPHQRLTWVHQVSKHASMQPGKPALRFRGETTTWAQLDERSRRLASALEARGVGKGDRVLVLLTNRPEFVETLVAINRLGAIAVPVNFRLVAAEVSYLVEDSGSRAIVVEQPLAPVAAAVREGKEGELPCLVVGDAAGPGGPGAELYEEALTASDPSSADGPDDLGAVALIMYTSGTTAHPKGCLISHEALVRNGIALGRQRFAIRDDDVFWDPLPMFHMSAVLPLVGVIDAGAAFASMVHFDAEAALDQMEREGATLAFPAFPTVTLALLNHPSFPRRDLRRLRMLNTTGPPETAYQVQRALPHVVQISPYGCTEAGGVVCFSEASDTPEQRATFSGRPFRGLEVRIVDPLGRPLPPGEPGEITVRGYALFDGYYKDPEKTAASVDADGFFHTGDLGVVDEDGRVQFRGRLKDMLKVGGENVAAAEIEALLCQHPAVAVCQVVGIPDPRLEEVPAAFVELVPGASASPEELIAFCRERVASFKVPRVVRQVSEWPMSATKILKRKLREQLLEELQASQAQG